MKHKISIGLLIVLQSWATSGTSKEYHPSSALEYQQTTNTRIVVEDNFLRFFTGGEERITVDVNGNVGIGTSTPAYNLDVTGGGTATTIARISSGGHANVRQSRGSSSFDGGYLFYTGTTLDWRFQESANAGDLHIRDESLATNIMTFQDNTGKVGIGTTNPYELLTLVDGNLFIGRKVTNLAESGRIRFSEFENTSYQGAFIHYNGSTNVFNIGVHNVNDSNSSSDLNAISILRSNGYVGIGAAAPSEKLHVNDGSIFGHNSNSAFLKIKRKIGQPSIKGIFDNTTGYDGHVIIDAGRTSDAIYLNNYVSSNVYMVTGGGNVGIGTSSPGSKLHVVGNIHGSTFTASTAPHWPDYVFEDTYELNDIEEVEKYIEKNHHLPEIPSAAEVEANGIDIVDMQARLLQKIEELTLYVIEQNKRIEEQQQRIKKLETNSPNQD